MYSISHGHEGFSQALLFTSTGLVYLNIVKKLVKWEITFDQLISISTMGLDILLHYYHKSFLRTRKLIGFFARRRILCITSEMQQFLLVKIDQHFENLKFTENLAVTDGDHSVADPDEPRIEVLFGLVE